MEQKTPYLAPAMGRAIAAAAFASVFAVGGTCVQAAARSADAPGATPATLAKSDAKAEKKVEKHIQDLHAKLKITQAEESQWATVAQAMRDNVKEVDAAIDNRKSLAGNASAIDDLNAYGDIARAHADGVKNLAAAFAPLYASMSDEQKKAADQVFANRTRDGKKLAKAMN
jgi:protein CpxP